MMVHGKNCAHFGLPVGQSGLGVRSLADPLCCCDPHGDKARAAAFAYERYQRRNVLWQDKVWYPATGDPVRVKDMDLDYMRNTVLFLEARAERLKFAYEWNLAVNPGVQGEHALDAVDAILQKTLETGAVEWLHDTPLVRRLDRRIRKRRKRALREDFGVVP